VRPSQLVKSASFRIAAAYVGLFTVSVSILAGLIYLNSTSALRSEIHTRIGAESTALKEEFGQGGIARLLQAVADRQRGRLVGGLDYTILDGKGTHVFGDLPSTKCIPGWQVFTGPPDGDEPVGQMEKLGVRITPLGGGYCLLVADDIGKVDTFGSLILDSFGWIFLLTLLFAVAGGIFLSSRVLRRIEAINRTAEAIIEGDMSQRIARRAAPDDLDRLASTLNRMLDRMTGLMETLHHVSNDIAHDLRTPLGRLRHMLEEASRTASSRDEFRQVLAQAIEEVDDILATFGAILRIAQIESGCRRGGFCRVSLSSLIADVCETFAPSFEDAGKVLRAKIEPDLWIHGDRELLVQSAVNLLENAIAHTPAGTEVSVRLRRLGNSVAFEVADNGHGVPDGATDQIFKRFYRVEQSRTASGNGLGLSIVAAVADLHSAHISATNIHPGLKIDMVFAQPA
jgi:signal transduction histidine kinase